MYIKLRIKISLFSAIIFASSTLLFPSFLSANPSLKTIAITQIVDHPSANAVREGVLVALKDKGYEEGKTITLIYENAQGNPVTASQIAQKFMALKPDLIIPITTPSTQAVVKANEGYALPIVFAAVTDPVASGVVDSLTHPGGSVTGVTDAAPIKRQIDVFKQALPHIKTLGILYNPGDNSSATPVKEARELAKEEGIALIEATAFKSSDVSAAMQQLVGKGVDAVFVPLDNTILSAMNAVLKIAFQYKIPIVSSDSDSVAQGALISSGYTHFDTGYRAGEIAVQVLEGDNPGDISVESAQSLNIYINKKSAQRLNITFPEAILKTAKEM
jgi:putative ABC transport system substrate-binding protein